MALGLSVTPLSLAQALDDGTLPSGGNVVGGSAHFDYSSPNELHIQQNSQRAVIDWNSFNIGKNALTQFHQNNNSAIVVNRVMGQGNDPTQILGTLKANGQIIVLDRNGVLFGKDSVIDVGGIIASTGDIDASWFIKNDGPVRITDINPDSAIVNQGNITVAEAGLAAFVAPTVINQGIIAARLGKAELLAGTSATLDLYGDGLIELAVNEDTLSQAVINQGVINAQGGTVLLKAAAAKEIVDNLVLNTGVISAKTFDTDHKGHITLLAEGSNKTEKTGDSAAINGGYITASGLNEGDTGGYIEVLADHVVLQDNSLIDASGDNGGGNIKIGGDYLGSGDTPTAKTTYVADNSLIVNDAITNGNGGRTTIWSDDTTKFHGTVLSRGGQESGNGGFLETSGKINLQADGYADLTASNGNKGTYLLDPADITIYGNEASVYNNANLVSFWDFNEGAGTTAEDRTNTNDGTIVNAVYNGGGVYGSQALEFNGTDTYVDLGTMDTQAVPGLTLSAWIRADDFDTDDARIISKATGTATNDHDWMLSTIDSGGIKLRFRLRTDATGTTTTLIADPGSDLVAGQWYHVAAIYDGTDMRLFLNGVDVGSVAKTGNVSINPAVGVRIGDNPVSSLFFDGLIDDVAVFSAAIQGNEFQELIGNRFTVDGLEFMAQTADVVLQADNTITLDLQGDTLNLAGDRSITLTTTNGDISTASPGSITTTRTGTGGNITFTSGGAGDININHALNLSANNDGVVTFNSGGNSNGLNLVFLTGIGAGDLLGHQNASSGTSSTNTSFAIPGSVLKQSSNFNELAITQRQDTETGVYLADFEGEDSASNESGNSKEYNTMKYRGQCLAAFANGTCIRTGKTE